MKKQIANILSFCFILININACYDANVDYSQDCITEYPLSGVLTVKVSLNSLNKSVPVKIFQGKYDDGDLILEDTIYAEKKKYDLTPNFYYSVAAKYNTERGDIIVVNGDEIKVYTNTESDTACYRLKNAVVNCKLKY